MHNNSFRWRTWFTIPKDGEFIHVAAGIGFLLKYVAVSYSLFQNDDTRGIFVLASCVEIEEEEEEDKDEEELKWTWDCRSEHLRRPFTDAYVQHAIYRYRRYRHPLTLRSDSLDRSVGLHAGNSSCNFNGVVRCS